MKARCLGDALLRSHPSSLLSFLAPSIPLSLWSSSAAQFSSFLVSARTPVRVRTLATKSSPLQASSSAATAPLDDAPEDPNPSPNHEKSEVPSSSDDIGLRMSHILNSFSPRRQSDSESTHNSFTANPLLAPQPIHTSADTMRRAIKGDLHSSNHLRRTQGGIAAQMEGVTMIGQALSNEMNSRIKLSPLRPPVRLDAFIGRSEEVDPSKGVDLGRALRKMEVKLALNNVRSDFQNQRFHERAGLKRKRLKRVRWRRRFKEGFRAVVAKVEDMRRRGW